MVATLGSGESGGSLYIMDLSEAIDSAMGSWTTYRVHSLDRTMWTADCSSDGTHAAFGELIESELKCRTTKISLAHRYTIFVTCFCFNFVLHNSIKLDAFTDNFATESAFLNFF